MSFLSESEGLVGVLQFWAGRDGREGYDSVVSPISILRDPFLVSFCPHFRKMSKVKIDD